jgi:hypothetical protein
MSRTRVSVTFLFCLLATVVLLSPVLAGDHAFVGSGKCKMCHNSEAKGAQFKKWSEGPHANAFATLGSDKAKEVAAAKGIDDPQKAPECLKCHVTGHGMAADKLTDKYNAEEGVGCESCHGAGGDYWKMSVMKDQAQSVAAGLVIPTEETCTGCHNPENPTHPGFNYEEYLAKIAHPNPKKAK